MHAGRTQTTSYQLSAISYEPEARRSRSAFGWLAHRFSGGAANPSPFVPRPSSLASRGFTLVELMVVIGIIGLLIAIALPAFSNMITKSRSTHTAATINALNLGLEQFRAAEQLGGALPPSYGLYPGTGTGLDSWATPHSTNTGSNTLVSSCDLSGQPSSQPPLQGANLLAWALVGADLLGTPGFKNANGAADAGGGDFGGWTDDTGTQYDASGAKPNGLYALKANTNGQPAGSRQGPFVDTSKMTFPKPVSTGSGIISQFALDKIEGAPTLASICFLDTFNQPILYYKANIGKTMPVDSNPNPLTNTGVYNQADNAYITGGRCVGGIDPPGIDLGAGPNPAPYNAAPYMPGKNHLLANSFPGVSFSATFQSYLKPIAAPQGFTPLKGTMEYHFWNPAVNAAWRPQREDSYILLSAGPDGRFGTSDDIGNFPINP